jgi:hypothetical protein
MWADRDQVDQESRLRVGLAVDMCIYPELKLHVPNVHVKCTSSCVAILTLQDACLHANSCRAVRSLAVWDVIPVLDVRAHHQYTATARLHDDPST